MLEFSKHVIFDEIEYDRNELEAFVKQFDDCVVNHADWQKRIHGGKQSYGVPKGYNVVDTTLLEGKIPTEYPEVRNLLDKFKIAIDEKHVVLSHYDVGFKLRPHTDHACQASVMFPILPEDAGAELIFHDVEPPYEKAFDYKDYWDKIDYVVQYQTKHPTAFTTQVPHSVAEVKESRIYLKFMIFNHTFGELKDLCKKGELF